jgi:hypothetical protein
MPDMWVFAAKQLVPSFILDAWVGIPYQSMLLRPLCLT